MGIPFGVVRLVAATPGPDGCRVDAHDRAQVRPRGDVSLDFVLREGAAGDAPDLVLRISAAGAYFGAATHREGAVGRLRLLHREGYPRVPAQVAHPQTLFMGPPSHSMPVPSVPDGHDVRGAVRSRGRATPTSAGFL